MIKMIARSHQCDQHELQVVLCDLPENVQTVRDNLARNRSPNHPWVDQAEVVGYSWGRPLPEVPSIPLKSWLQICDSHPRSSNKSLTLCFAETYSSMFGMKSSSKNLCKLFRIFAVEEHPVL
eukprot:g24220.t1